MRKYGKYERMPDGTRAKQPAVKSMLLQTYFTSLVCLVLCVTMFFGTTYAWFTSEVNNEGNEIYIGTLDVDLLLGEISLKENTTTKIFGNNILWEPGYTAVRTLTVQNKGNLAFKYMLAFTDGDAKNAEGITVDLAAIAQYFDVWVYNYRDNQNTAPTLTTYQAITEQDSGWVSVGPLDQLLAGKAVFEGSMEPVPDATASASETTAHTYAIALHMKENADESIMGHKISLNVKLVAYQMGSEPDGFGNANYDSNVQFVSTGKELQEALQNGGHVALLDNIVLTEGVTVPADKTVVLDLNGKTISQTKACTDSYSMITNNGTLTITGDGKLSFTDSGAGDTGTSWASYTIRNSGSLTVENGVIEHLGQQSGNMNNAIFHYSGSTTINGGTIYTAYSRSVRLWMGTMTINGGTFEGQVWVQPMDDTCSLTINGGYFSPADKGNDASSVFVTNDTKNVAFSVTGGEFETKIGCSKADKLVGCITGGTFTEAAKNDTNASLFASTYTP